MRPVAWLAVRELTVARSRAVIACATVAAAVALGVATESISRARESAIARQIDQIGPPLRIIPEGTTASNEVSLPPFFSSIMAGKTDEAGARPESAN